jgi:hypothetical protein
MIQHFETGQVAQLGPNSCPTVALLFKSLVSHHNSILSKLLCDLWAGKQDAVYRSVPNDVVTEPL